MVFYRQTVLWRNFWPSVRLSVCTNLNTAKQSILPSCAVIGQKISRRWKFPSYSHFVRQWAGKLERNQMVSALDLHELWIIHLASLAGSSTGGISLAFSSLKPEISGSRTRKNPADFIVEWLNNSIRLFECSLYLYSFLINVFSWNLRKTCFANFCLFKNFCYLAQSKKEQRMNNA